MVLRPGPCVLCFQSAPKKRPRRGCEAEGKRGRGSHTAASRQSCDATTVLEHFPPILVRLAPSRQRPQSQLGTAAEISFSIAATSSPGAAGLEICGAPALAPPTPSKPLEIKKGMPRSLRRA